MVCELTTGKISLKSVLVRILNHPQSSEGSQDVVHTPSSVPRSGDVQVCDVCDVRYVINRAGRLSPLEVSPRLTVMGECWLCPGSPASLHCDDCPTSSCSPQHHQLHKQGGNPTSCLPFKIVHREGVGNCVVATEDIMPGKVHSVISTQS